jgi:hypothetical protein
MGAKVRNNKQKKRDIMIFNACVRAIIYIIAYARAIINIRNWKISNFIQAKG